MGVFLDLKGLPANHDNFIGVDSDGCVYDTMNVKQKEHFHPMIIRHWKLEPVAEALRECAVFSNLTSRRRGANRYHALLRTFELLSGHPDVVAANFSAPRVDDLRRYVNSGLPMGRATLEAEARRTGSEELFSVLEWTDLMDADLAAMQPAPPFENAVIALEQMRQYGDVVVVSQTPESSLFREWRHHRLDHIPAFIAGQEHGSKTEQLLSATQGKYDRSRVLMVGDAPGDLVASREAGCLFYPIMPGAEEESWLRLHKKIYPAFLKGGYDETLRAALEREFLDALPETPPWRSKEVSDE